MKKKRLLSKKEKILLAHIFLTSSTMYVIARSSVYCPKFFAQWRVVPKGFSTMEYCVKFC